MNKCTDSVRYFNEIILSNHSKIRQEFQLAADKYENRVFSNFYLSNSKKIANHKVYVVFVFRQTMYYP